MALDVPDLGYRPTLGTCARRAAEQWGERDFVVTPDRRVTFAEVDAASRRLGKELLALGVGKGTRVGLLDTYSTEWVVAWFAITRIGALAMPCSSTYRPAELATVLRLGDVDTLLAAPAILGRDVPDLLEHTVPGLTTHAGDADLMLDTFPSLRRLLLWGPTDRAWARELDVHATGEHPLVSDALLDAVEEQVVPADWAQVTSTSGSSATPKGVVHSHGAIVRTTASALGPPAPERSAAFCAFPFFWIGGTLALGSAVQRGATLCVLPRFEPGPALDMIEREGCTAVMAWPSLVQAMRADPTFDERDLSHIPTLRPDMGGLVPVSPVPGIGYHRSMSELVGNWQGSERHAIDVDAGGPLPDLVEGELVVRGFGMMQGYYKKEREETFDADGWLHTGDRVFLHGNRVFFVGRFTEMLKSQGANVAPREVETALEAWDEIQHCFVFGLPHAELGEEVCAAIVFAPGRSLTPDEMRSRALEELSSYKVPTRYEVLDTEDDVPWLPTGKPDKRALRDRIADDDDT
jgi:acyl-CoA synthetase (AMP-forming)/AMP-acid ligase II